MKRLELYLLAQSPRYDFMMIGRKFNFYDTQYYCTADDRTSILPIGLSDLFPRKLP